MKTIEEKISKLEQALQNQILDTKNKEIEEIKGNEKKSFEKYIKRMKKKLKEELDAYKSREKLILMKNEGKIHSEGEQILIETKNSIKRDILKSLKKILVEKYKCEIGEKFLENSLSSLKKDITDAEVIYLSSNSYERDLILTKKIFPNNEIKVSHEIKIGGIIAENNENHFRYNYTLDYKLKQNESQILRKCEDIFKISRV